MALIAVLLLLLVSLAIGVLSANSSRTEMTIAHNQTLDLRALAVAEAGINMAKKQIESHFGIVNNELALNTGCTCTTSTCNYGVGTSGSGLAALGSLANVTLPGDTIAPRCYRFASFGGATSDGYYLRVEDNLDEETGLDDPLTDVDRGIRVISKGVVGTAERTIVAIFNVTPGIPGSSTPGIYGRDSVKLSGAATADSYTMVGGVPVYGEGVQIRSNVSMDISTAAGAIQGDLISAGDSTSINYHGNPPTGTVTYDADPLAFAPVAACGPPYSGTSGIHLGAGGTYDTTNGELKQSGGNTVELDPGTYCFGPVTLSGGSTLKITGPTVINVTGKFTGSGGTLQNTTMDPTNFQLNSSFVGNNAVVLSSGGTNAYLQVYAPNGQVKVSGGGDMFGSIVGANVEISASYFHQAGSGGGGTPGIVNVTSWHEVQH